jgi:glycerophosphoryl diester phosphodiesterase
MRREEHQSWVDRRILAYAHRGGALEAPASTLYAMERAIALGATGIELDVHASVDGVPVISHDPTVDASSNGSGAIAKMTLASLRALDHAYDFVEGRGDAGDTSDAFVFRGRAPADRRFGVATLDEALEATRGAFVNLDLKDGAPSVPGYEAAVAASIARHRRESEVIVTSFDDARTETFAAIAPGIATSPGLSGLARFTQAVRSGGPVGKLPSHHVALQVPDRFGGSTLVDEAFVEAAHDLGLAVHVWTINDVETMQRLVELGVDGIMSDTPTVLVDALDALGVAYRR